jgi:hypothetical protein
MMGLHTACVTCRFGTAHWGKPSHMRSRTWCSLSDRTNNSGPRRHILRVRVPFHWYSRLGRILSYAFTHWVYAWKLAWPFRLNYDWGYRCAAHTTLHIQPAHNAHMHHAHEGHVQYVHMHMLRTYNTHTMRTYNVRACAHTSLPGTHEHTGVITTHALSHDVYTSPLHQHESILRSVYIHTYSWSVQHAHVLTNTPTRTCVCAMQLHTAGDVAARLAQPRASDSVH